MNNSLFGADVSQTDFQTFNNQTRLIIDQQTGTMETHKPAPKFNFPGAAGLTLNTGDLARQIYTFKTFGMTGYSMEKALGRGRVFQTGQYKGRAFSTRFRGNQYVSSQSVLNYF